MHIFVIGASGLVGQNICTRARAAGHDVTGTYHTDDTYGDVQLDKTKAARIEDLVEETDPDAIVDTAAFHDVDACESERETAWEVNVTGTRNVACAAERVDASLLYLSTDYVFAGDPDDAPYVETDPVSPANYYGQCKYAAEQATKITTDVTVFRPSVVYGEESENFVTWALDELRAGNEVTIVDDQISTPTYAPDLAEACVRAVEDDVTGLYHASGPVSLSRYEFTVQLAEACGADTEQVTPISTESLGQEAQRPTDSSLDSMALYEAIDLDFQTPNGAFEHIAADSS